MSGTSEKHVRQQCRNRITELLEEADLKLGRVEVNVFESRVYQLESRQLPAVAVYSKNQVVESRKARKQPTIQDRFIQTRVVLAVVADELVENDIDCLALQVENKIATDPTLGGVAHTTFFMGSEEGALSSETDKPFALLDLLFESHVLTLEGKAERSIQQ